MQVRKWAVASCKQLSTSIVQGIVIGHCPFHNFKSIKSSNLQRSVVNTETHGSCLNNYCLHYQWQKQLLLFRSSKSLPVVWCTRIIIGKDGALWTNTDTVKIFTDTNIGMQHYPTTVPLTLNTFRMTESEQGDTLINCSPQQDTILAEFLQWLPVAAVCEFATAIN